MWPAVRHRLFATTTAGFLSALFAIGLAFRLAVVAVLGNPESPRMYEYGHIARSLVAGRGFAMHWYYMTRDAGRRRLQTAPVAHEGAFMPPMNAYVIAGAFALFGETPRAATALMVLHAIVGAAGALLCYRLARRIAGEVPARLAAMLMALWPPLAFASVTFSGTVLYVAQILVVLALAADAIARGRWSDWLLLGLSLGILVYLRSEALMLAPLVVAAAALARRRRGVGVPPARAAAALLVALAVVAPWTARNAALYGELVPVISHPWTEIWRGNNPVTEGSSYFAWGEPVWLQNERFTPFVRRLDSLRYDERFERRADSIFREEALAFIREQPGRAAGLAARRALLHWTFDARNPQAGSPLYIALSIGLLVLVLAGMWLHGRERRRPPGAALPIVVFMAFTTLMVAATHNEPRHQIYMFAAAFPFAGIALARLLGSFDLTRAETDRTSAPPDRNH